MQAVPLQQSGLCRRHDQAAGIDNPDVARAKPLFHPDAPTFYEIKQLAWHMASLWEAVAGSAERFETVMLHYQALRIQEATRETFALIKTIAKKPGCSA